MVQQAEVNGKAASFEIVAPPILLNYEGAAKLTGISERTLRDMVTEKRIPFKKIGARVFFPYKRLVEWANETDAVEGAAV